MSKFFIFILALISLCCRHPVTQEQPQTFKDSVVKRFLDIAESIEFYDTSNYDYTILSAYMNNDSGFFSRMNKYLVFYNEYLKNKQKEDACLHLIRLSELGADEAYRFRYWALLCDYHQTITITRTGDSIKLRYLEYRLWDDSNDVEHDKKIIKPVCDISKDFEKDIPLSAWEELKKRIKYADYWGLKGRNDDNRVLDGSDWQIDGYTTRPGYGTVPQVQSVKRISPSGAVAEIGLYLFKLTNQKPICHKTFN